VSIFYALDDNIIKLNATDSVLIQTKQTQIDFYTSIDGICAPVYNTLKFNFENDSIIPNLKLYPNPFQSVITVQMDNLFIGNFSLVVFDITGRKLYQGSYFKMSTNFSQDINFSSIIPNSGIYLIEFTFGNIIERRKVAKS
jgi:hypothetical protein